MRGKINKCVKLLLFADRESVCAFEFISISNSYYLLMYLSNLLSHREDIKAAYAGDIVAIGGLKEVITGESSRLLMTNQL
jgi:predicted membrane GTPase involved in stress response